MNLVNCLKQVKHLYENHKELCVDPDSIVLYRDSSNRKPSVNYWEGFYILKDGILQYKIEADDYWFTVLQKDEDMPDTLEWKRAYYQPAAPLTVEDLIASDWTFEY